MERAGHCLGQVLAKPAASDIDTGSGAHDAQKEGGHDAEAISEPPPSGTTKCGANETCNSSQIVPAFRDASGVRLWYAKYRFREPLAGLLVVLEGTRSSGWDGWGARCSVGVGASSGEARVEDAITRGVLREIRE